MKTSHEGLVTWVACVLAGTSLLAPLARAEPAAEVPSAVVRYGDLDLNSSEGVRALYRRIGWAAREVCAPYASSARLSPSAAWQSCVTQAVERAVQRVDRPLLTAYHRRQVGHV